MSIQPTCPECRGTRILLIDRAFIQAPLHTLDEDGEPLDVGPYEIDTDSLEGEMSYPYFCRSCNHEFGSFDHTFGDHTWYKAEELIQQVLRGNLPHHTLSPDANVKRILKDLRESTEDSW